MPGAKAVIKSSFNFRIVALFAMLSLTFLFFIFLYVKEDSFDEVKNCSSEFYFDEFEEITEKNDTIKKNSDYFLHKIVKLNGGSVKNKFCATSIKGRGYCIQYFQPEAAAGGGVRICVNPKLRALSSVEFGE